MSLSRFNFECRDCGEKFEDEADGEVSMESECPNCGNWEYSDKPINRDL